MSPADRRRTAGVAANQCKGTARHAGGSTPAAAPICPAGSTTAGTQPVEPPPSPAPFSPSPAPALAPLQPHLEALYPSARPRRASPKQPCRGDPACERLRRELDLLRREADGYDVYCRVMSAKLEALEARRGRRVPRAGQRARRTARPPPARAPQPSVAPPPPAKPRSADPARAAAPSASADGDEYAPLIAEVAALQAEIRSRLLHAHRAFAEAEALREALSRLRADRAHAPPIELRSPPAAAPDARALIAADAPDEGQLRAAWRRHMQLQLASEQMTLAAAANGRLIDQLEAELAELRATVANKKIHGV